MDGDLRKLENLFRQLGLFKNERTLNTFLTEHSPLAPEIDLPEAPFWTPGQSRFLHEAIAQDADWSGVVDLLDVMLRK